MSAEPTTDDALLRRLRAPAAIVLLAAAAGIVVDRVSGPPVMAYWLLIAGGALASLVRWPNAIPRAVGLLVSIGGLFGLWHHAWWSDPPAGHIYHVATDEGRLVELQGRVAEAPWTRNRRNSQPQTIVLLDSEGILNGDRLLQPAAGRIRVQIDEAGWTADVGDRIRISGRLIRPAEAANPHGFDYRQWLRTQGGEAFLRVNRSSAVERLPSHHTPGDQLANWRNRLRATAVQRLRAATDERAAAVGEALLLGSRSQLPEDIRQAFVQSGLLHVLAISGVNVAVIWLGLIRLCRALGISLRQSGVVVIVGLTAYAWLTDANPPIVRAVTFAVVLQVAELSGRRVAALQGMALAGLVVLVRNPTDLLNPGAQLSFLSVAVLSTANRWCDRRLSASESDVDAAEMSPWERCRRRILEGCSRACVATGAVWLASAPLVAYRFHLLSMTGLVLNLLLAPLFLVLLWIGYAWLVSVAAIPMLSDPLAWLFTGLLHGLLQATSWGGSWSQGFAYCAGPPNWWIAGFYLTLIVLVGRPQALTVRQCVAGLLVWSNLGLAWALRPPSPEGVVCDVLAVGHGLAIVVRGPTGRTLVYDVGCLAGGEIAAEAVCQTIWDWGRHRVDALVVSHADADHCNGVPALAERLQPGVLFHHVSLYESAQAAVQEARRSWAAKRGTEASIAAGDRITWEADVAVQSWHPPHGAEYDRDNSNSVVLVLEYAGRRLMFTGDLERDGLNRLLRQPRRPADLVIAPHHGSRTANTAEFAAWTNPDWVIVSASDRRTADRIRDRYSPSAALFNTAVHGRVRCVISPEGTLTVTPFRTRVEDDTSPGASW